MNTALEWQFGGWLSRFSAPVAWSILGGTALGGLLLVFWLYRHTLRDLSPGARWLLTGLRAALLLVLLLCLANPSRVTISRPAAPDRTTLAVVVDRSDSMNAADTRGNSRLKNALRIWQRHIGEANEKFSKTAWYRFNTGLDPAETLDDATQGRHPGPETHLYEALGQVVAKDPGAIVCLTDGLDTTGADAQKLAGDAQRKGIPLYFVPGANRLRTSEMVNIRDIRLPPKVLRQTRFSAQAVLEISVAEDREMPVSLWSGDQLLATQKFKLRVGLNTFPWAVAVNAAEPGPLPLEFRVGEGATQQVSGSTTMVIEKTTVDILYYQGALQWGYRFLLAALRSDPSFRVTSIINPALGLRMSASTSSDLATLSDLPETAAELKKYQIVVLAHVFADQLSPLQQQALVDYAKGGGGVLFIAPDSNATARFAGTAVEQMLPVVFEPAKIETPEETATRRFQEQMRSQSSGDDTTDRREPVAKLQPFALPAGASRSKISDLFSSKEPENLPRFSEYARVRLVKPGAEILAVHPTDRGLDGKSPRVLLARQQFGDGFTAALTTDLLWRWKMSLPHESRAPEKFWQQLFLSLTPASGQGLRLVKNMDSAAVRQPATFRVESAPGEAAPRVVAISPAGVSRVLDLQPIPEATSAAWKAVFTPEINGRWEVQASDAAGNRARITLPVKDQTQTLETANLPANLEGMRRLAESTGGTLIEDDPVFSSRVETPGTEQKRSQPLWNSQWLLGLLLGLYGAELLARRWWKLL